MQINYRHQPSSFPLPGRPSSALSGTWIAPDVFMLPTAPRVCILRNPKTGAIARATPESFGML